MPKQACRALKPKTPLAMLVQVGPSAAHMSHGEMVPHKQLRSRGHVLRHGETVQRSQRHHSQSSAHSTPGRLLPDTESHSAGDTPHLSHRDSSGCSVCRMPVHGCPSGIPWPGVGSSTEGRSLATHTHTPTPL